jgi:hypothetical protein
VTLDDKMDGNTEDNQKVEVEKKIVRLYQKMCIASGYPFPDGTPPEVILGHMLLRESLCVLSEHIRHAPARISIIFEKLINTDEIKGCFANIIITYPYFPLDTIIKLASILAQEEEEILLGIEKVVNNKINFDDLNDSSTKKMNKIQKTFYEPQGLLVVLFIIFKYAADIIQLKEWSVIFLYLLLHNFDSSLYEILILIDLGFLAVFFIMSWFLRLVALRSMVFHIDLKLSKMLLPIRLITEIIYVVLVTYFIYVNIKDLPSIMSWYIPSRIAMMLVKIFLPMQPLTGTRKECSIKFSQIKRALGQLSFLIALIVTTAIYDYFLVVSKFDILLTNFCGDPSYLISNFFQYFENWENTNTQMLLCNLSLVSQSLFGFANTFDKIL